MSSKKPTKQKSKISTRPKMIRARCKGIIQSGPKWDIGRPCARYAMANGSNYCFHHKSQGRTKFDKTLFSMEDELDYSYTEEEREVPPQMNQSELPDLNESIEDIDNSAEPSPVAATEPSGSIEDMDISDSLANAIYEQVLKNSLREMRDKMNANLNDKFNQLIARLKIPAESVTPPKPAPKNLGSDSSNAPKQLYIHRQQPSRPLIGVKKSDKTTREKVSGSN